MRQVFLERDTLAVKEVSQPLLDDYSVLVEVHYSCISSGTEITAIAHASNHKIPFDTIPSKVKKFLESIATHGVENALSLVKGKLQSDVQILGYSCSGVVLAVGKKVKNFRTGDFVACAGAGFANHADIVCVPSNLAVRVTKLSSLKSASLTTLGAIALQALRRAQVKLGETVCIIGLGLIGQLALQLAKRSGCKVIAVDLVPERLALAQKNGADVVCHVPEQDIKKIVEFATDHYGADATLITASSKSDVIIQQAIEVTRKKGNIVLVGDVGLGMMRTPLYEKEIDILVSGSFGPGRYDSTYENQGNDYPYSYVRWTENRNMQAFLDLIERDQLTLESLITQEITIDEVHKAYESIKAKKELGVIISYVPHNEEIKVQPAVKDTSLPLVAIKFRPAIHQHMRVGIVGAGEFAQTKLMPIIANMSNTSIRAVVDANVNSSLNVSRKYGAAQALVNDADLFVQDLVDVVVIASPHKYHSDQALRALEQGKAVFMEKPMATDLEQFSRLKDFLITHPDIPFCVDYNRTFAPFIQKIKREVASRSTPLVIQYRMNAGFIPKEHWVQTDIGAGRIIGDACHIIDLFCFLTDSKPLSVSVETLHARQDNLFPTDNFSAQISFVDGSICTLLYTSLGHVDLGKERMELFYDSKSIVMDDYDYLEGFGLPKSFDETVPVADKGHSVLLNQFFSNLHQPFFKPPIPLDRLCTVAALTLLIDQLACEGGGDKQVRL